MCVLAESNLTENGGEHEDWQDGEEDARARVGVLLGPHLALDQPQQGRSEGGPPSHAGGLLRHVVRGRDADVAKGIK